jgi:hypothetical protein
MDKRLVFILLPMLTILSSCGSGSSSAVRHFEGDGWHSFQQNEYKVYCTISNAPDDSCRASIHILDLLSRGLLYGRLFYISCRLDTADVLQFLSTSSGRDSANRWLPPLENYSVVNYHGLGEDLEYFHGRPVYIEFPNHAICRRGLLRDTMQVYLEVDLSGLLPGPMMVYLVAITFDSMGTRCDQPFKNPTLERFAYRGWIL